MRPIAAALFLALALTQRAQCLPHWNIKSPAMRADVPVQPTPPVKRPALAAPKTEAPKLPFDISPTLDGGPKSLLENDFALLSSIRGNGATPLHRRVFGRVDGRDYMKFFADRVQAFGWSSDKHAVAYGAWGIIVLTQKSTDPASPPMRRLLTLAHEARHAAGDNAGWPHITCPDPLLGVNGQEVTGPTGAKLGGLDACDDTPDGAYGSSVAMLKNIQRFCTNCTGKVLADAGLYGDDHLNRVVGRARAELLEDLGK